MGHKPVSCHIPLNIDRCVFYRIKCGPAFLLDDNSYQVREKCIRKSFTIPWTLKFGMNSNPSKRFCVSSTNSHPPKYLPTYSLTHYCTFFAQSFLFSSEGTSTMFGINLLINTILDQLEIHRRIWYVNFSKCNYYLIIFFGLED